MRKNNFKKMAAVLMAAFLLCSSFASTGAIGKTADNVIAPMWVNTLMIGSVLNFTGTTANCTVSIDGYSGTTKISGTYELQLKSGSTYTTIKTWTASGTGEYLDWYGTHTVTKGNTYRLYVTAKVTRNGITETANGWTEATCK